jgi:hypothetical protein
MRSRDRLRGSFDRDFQVIFSKNGKIYLHFAKNGLVHFGASENDEKKTEKLTFRQMC